MSRRPARRRPARRRSRKNSGGEQLVLIGGGVLLVWLLLTGLVRFLAAHPWIAVVLVLCASGAMATWVVKRQRAAQWERVRSQGLRYALTQLDALHHRQFEHAVRDLMHRDGCADAVQVGGAGDNGADVKATDPFGRRWVIQCKHRRDGLAGAAIGTPDLQVLNGTGRPVHRGDVVVLVTNGRFTNPAIEFARDQRLHLVNRTVLAEWASGSKPLWELLRAVPPPRRPTPLS
ncbi:restriction endonuclease [Streptomyces sp. NPDC056524]|uniref:restriction endonuclease n=1 Tax=Streptomyces sp. NPDC056524 TaxID=3345851 RepID=UPI0036ADAC57